MTHQPDFDGGWDDVLDPHAAPTPSYASQSGGQPSYSSGARPASRAVSYARPRRTWHKSRTPQVTLAGLLGGLATWALIEFFGEPDRFSSEDFISGNVGATMVAGMCIGLVILKWDIISAKAWPGLRMGLAWAIPVMLVVTFIGGLIVDAVYPELARAALMNSLGSGIENWDYNDFATTLRAQFHLARGAGWAIMGLAAGIGLGLAARNRQMVINGAIGGAIGGFVGGVLFDFFLSGPLSRIVGFAITGAAIGLAISLVELLRRQSWLEIVSGPMAGRQFVLSGGSTTVGRSPYNSISIPNDPGMAATHAAVATSDHGAFVQGADPFAPTTVNGLESVSATELRDGDVLQMGGTMLRFREKEAHTRVASPDTDWNY